MSDEQNSSQEHNNDPSEENADEVEEKFLCFTKELIPCKLLFFTTDAGFATLRFLGLFYITSGLTVAQLGLIHGIGCGFALLGHPFWGAFLDSTLKHRTIIFVMINFGTTVLEFVKPWVFMLFSQTGTRLDCMGNTTIVHSTFNNSGTNCTTHTVLLNGNTAFYAAVVNCLLSSIGISGLTTYMEGAVVKTVFTRKKEHSYGEQKVFGPLGTALGSFLAGVAVDHYHPKGISPYIASLYVYLPLSLLQIPFVAIIAKQAKWDYVSKKKQEKERGGIFNILKVEMKKRDTIMFFITAFVSGNALLVYKHYLFLYMHAVMDTSKTIMSLMSVTNSLSELAVYPFSSKLIKLFGGRMRCIITSMFASAFCLTVLSFAKIPWIIFPLAVLKGVFGSLCWTALIEETWFLFPKEISNTAIGIFMGFHQTSAMILTYIFGGLVFHKLGGSFLFRSFAVMNCLWCFVLIIYLRIRKSKSKTVPLPVTNSFDGNVNIEAEERSVDKEL